MSHEYRALLEKVDGFTTAVTDRRRADLACRPGCSSCCEVWLTVSPVEAQPLEAAVAALDPETRARIAERGRRELEREAQAGRAKQSSSDTTAGVAAHETSAAATDTGNRPRCAMLEADGRCAVYAARPLVCRTQGLPLQYPAGVVPEAAVRGRTSRGEITYCPLNFEHNAPAAPDVLDAERVNQLLALVNLRFAQAHGLDPEARTALSALAAAAAKP